MNRKIFRMASLIMSLALLIGMLFIVGCSDQSANNVNVDTTAPQGNNDSTSGDQETSENVSETTSDEKLGLDPLPPLEEDIKYGKPISSETLPEFTEEQIAKLKEMKPLGSWSSHYMLDWGTITYRGMVDTFEAVGGTVINTDANRSMDKQMADIESVILQQVDVAMAIGVDTSKFGTAVKKLNEANIPVILAGGQPDEGDYVTNVDPAGYDGGYQAGEYLVEALQQKGVEGKALASVGVKSFILTCSQRQRGFEDAVMEAGYYIVARGEGDTADDCQTEFENMLTAHPEIVGAFGVYETPALGMQAACTTLGRDDILITTIDLSRVMAENFAKKEGNIVYTSAQQLYENGVVMAKCALLTLLGVEVPDNISVPMIPTDWENAKEAFEIVYNEKWPW